MPLYVLIGHDVPNSSEKRQAVRPRHLARLQALQDENRLVIAGPNPTQHGETTVTGSVVIADFANDEAVQQWVSDEPYLLEGVYSHVDIKPFIQVLPNKS